jgi:hypothetical protein
VILVEVLLACTACLVLTTVSLAGYSVMHTSGSFFLVCTTALNVFLGANKPQYLFPFPFISVQRTFLFVFGA